MNTVNKHWEVFINHVFFACGSRVTYVIVFAVACQPTANAWSASMRKIVGKHAQSDLQACV